MDDPPPYQESIALLAARQHGHVARRQLIALGMPGSTIDSWVAAGDLIVVHHGVYAVGYRRVEPIALAAAAVLACGPRAVLSHDSAAALWGLRRWPARPEVIAPRVRRPGIDAHRSRTLTTRDTTTQLGVRTTIVARTLVDIRPRLTGRQFTRLVKDARVRHLIGSETAERLLGDTAHQGLTRSQLEDAFIAFLAAYELPAAQTNVLVNGVEVDVWFAEARLIVELDGWDTHRDRSTFESDRERDADQLVAGVLTIRVTEDRLTNHPAREAERLRTILSARTG